VIVNKGNTAWRNKFLRFLGEAHPPRGPSRCGTRASGCGRPRSLGRLGRGRTVLVVGLFLVVRAVVLAWELNRPEVTAACAYVGDIHPALPYLIPAGTDRIVASINRLTGFEKREMPVARPAVIPEGGEARVIR
jgi:hypothetical protein